MKCCASHKVKLSVPPTPAGTSRCEASLHAPKVYLSCRKAHLVEKKQPLSNGQRLFLFWGGRWDSNPRSSVPQTDALGQLRYTHHIGAPEGTRTPGPLLRRQVLYPAELQAPVCPYWTNVERVMGIEPTQPAWKAGVLPLNYTRVSLDSSERNLSYHRG